MYLVDKIMHFIYNNPKKNLIFDEMHQIKTPKLFNHAIFKKPTHLNKENA